MGALRRGDWLGLALAWLGIAEAAIRQAERLYARSLQARDERYERARDALVERLREERQVMRIEHTILAECERAARRAAKRELEAA